MVSESWLVFGQMAPYLLFGFLVAGMLSVWLSPQWVERHLGGRGLGPVLKASLFGVPLPLCSCGVIPVSASLRQHGASRAAVTSFLLSTPQTGVDSIAVTYALLGPVFAILRPVAALITGLFGGGLVQILDEPNETESLNGQKPDACSDDCCSGGAHWGVWSRMLKYGFVTLPRDIAGALIVGIFIAGAMTALVPPDYLAVYIGGGFVSILLMMAAGIPVYVCATASVPIADGFMHLGASPGAALAFLIAGPATNAAAFTTIWKVLGRRSAILYLTAVAVSAIVFGLALNGLLPAVDASSSAVSGHVHGEGESGVVSNLWAVVLLAVLAFSYWRSAQREDDLDEVDGGSGGLRQANRLEFLVSGMTCSHCASSVQRALAECTGVNIVNVDLKSGRVNVAGEDFNREGLESAITALGFSVEIPNQADSD